MSTASSSSSSSGGAFAKHKNAATATQNDNNTNGAKMSLLARFLIFLLIPSFTGLAGLGISYFQSIMQNSRLTKNNNDSTNSEEVHEVNFDRDFVTPFLLALALVIVLGFQTNGFSGESNRRRGAFVWPKARTVEKVRKERVIVDDDDDKKGQ